MPVWKAELWVLVHHSLAKQRDVVLTHKKWDSRRFQTSWLEEIPRFSFPQKRVKTSGIPIILGTKDRPGCHTTSCTLLTSSFTFNKLLWRTTVPNFSIQREGSQFHRSRVCSLSGWITGNKKNDSIVEVLRNRLRFIKQKYPNVWKNLSHSRDKTST